MVKHIIMLALCFMVYIVINIDTVTAPGAHSSYVMVTAPFDPMAISARCLKFTWLIECYNVKKSNLKTTQTFCAKGYYCKKKKKNQKEKMVEMELIKIHPFLQTHLGIKNFQEAMNHFYGVNGMLDKNDNFANIPFMQCEMFKNNELYNIKQDIFHEYFGQIQITDDKRSALDADPLIIERTHIPFTFYHTKETPEYFCLRYSFHIIF